MNLPGQTRPTAFGPLHVPKLLYVGVRYERDGDDSSEEVVIFARSARRFEDCYLMLVKRALFERVLGLLEQGALEIAARR